LKSSQVRQYNKDPPSPVIGSSYIQYHQDTVLDVNPRTIHQSISTFTVRVRVMSLAAAGGDVLLGYRAVLCCIYEMIISLQLQINDYIQLSIWQQRHGGNVTILLALFAWEARKGMA
jgi:hypothetical protein